MELKNNEVIKKLSSKDIWDQLNQTQEECGELVTAINHYRRKKSQETYEALCEEFADVIIMVQQALLYLENQTIEKKVNEKLARARERLGNGTI